MLILFYTSDEGKLHRTEKNSQVSSSLSVINLPWTSNEETEKLSNNLSQCSSKDLIDLTENKINSTEDDQYHTSQNVSVIDFSDQNLDTTSTCHENQFSNLKSLTEIQPTLSSRGANSSVKSSQLNTSIQIPETSANSVYNPVTANNHGQLTIASRHEYQHHLVNNINNVRKQAMLMKARHMRLKSRLMRDKKPKIFVQCKLCGQRLDNCQQIVEHSENHKLQLQCCVCNAKFASYCNLRRHCVGHVQTLLYKCLYCSCAYKRKDNLQTHMKKHANLQGSAPNRLQQYQPKSVNMVHFHTSSQKYVQSDSTNRTARPLTTAVYPVKLSSHASVSANIGKQLNIAVDQQVDINSPVGFDITSPDRLDTQTNHEADSIVPVEIQSDMQQGDKSSEITKQSQDTMSSKTLPTNPSIDLTVDFSCEQQSTEKQNTISLTDAKCAGMPKIIMEKTSGETNVTNMNILPIVINDEDGQDIDLQSNPDRTRQILNYTCSACSLSFGSINNLKRHIVSLHSEEIEQSSDYKSLPEVPVIGSEEADVIDIEHLNKFSFIYHSVENAELNVANTRHKANNADHLTRNTPHSNKKVRRGVNLVHGAPKCWVCGVTFESTLTALEHKICHPNEIPQCNGCTICKLELSSRETLRRHIRTHFGEEHQCQFCNSTYTRLDNLYTHMKNQHGWVKPNKYSRNTTF